MSRRNRGKRPGSDEASPPPGLNLDGIVEMTWEMPKVSRPAGPRVVEPGKPEDRFGRDEGREPDLFAALTPVPRPPRTSTPEPPVRPRSPSSELARANEPSRFDEVDFDVPTFDRRGVRPTFDAASDGIDDDGALAEKQAAGDSSAADRASVAPELASGGFEIDAHEPSIFDSGLGMPAPKPREVVAPVQQSRASDERTVEPPRETTPAPAAVATTFHDLDDDDLPFHSSSSDPSALDTIAYLTNELAGHIAAFDQRQPSASTETRMGFGDVHPVDARTWVDAAETQIDDPDIARLRRESEGFDLGTEDESLEQARADEADPAIAIPAAASTLGSGEPALADPDEAEHPMPRRPAIATFVIERAAPATAEREDVENRERAAESSRGGERVAIDWDELRAARARDWAAFEESASPAMGKPPRALEPDRETVIEPRRRVVRQPELPGEVELTATRAASAPRVEPLSEVTAEPPRARPPQPTVAEPRSAPPSRWLDAENPRPARRSWNDVAEPDLLDELDEGTERSEQTEVELAPFTSRSLAFAIDVAIVASTAIVAVLLGVIAFGASDYQNIDFVHSFRVLDEAFNYLLALIGVVYFTASHAWTGATLGKAMLGLQVLRAERSGPPSLGWSLLRTATYLGSSILGIGFLWALKRERRAWHDLAARTVVVRTHPAEPT